MKKFLFLPVVAFVLGSFSAVAQTEVTATTEQGSSVVVTTESEGNFPAPIIEMYHGEGCPHCADQFAFLPVLEAMYPELAVQEYEVWMNADNRELWGERMADFGREPQGVPTTIVGEEVLVGFNQSALVNAFERQFGMPVVSLDEAQAQVGYDPEAPTEDRTADSEPLSSRSLIIAVVIAIAIISVVVVGVKRSRA